VTREWLIAPPGTPADGPGWRPLDPGTVLAWDIRTGESPHVAVKRNGLLVATGLPMADAAGLRITELNVNAARLRRCTLLPLLLGWAVVIAAIAMSRFTWGEYVILVILPLLGAGTFNYITGWAVWRRGKS
jgi:hypothetical protein